jgi:hypothetical protein
MIENTDIAHLHVYVYIYIYINPVIQFGTEKSCCDPEMRIIT